MKAKDLPRHSTIRIGEDFSKRVKSSQPNVINPKEEANKIAHHFATRADQQTLPEDRQQIVNMPTQIPLSHQTNWKQFYQQQKNSAPGEDKLTYIFTPNLPPLSKIDF